MYIYTKKVFFLYNLDDIISMNVYLHGYDTLTTQPCLIYSKSQLYMNVYEIVFSL